MTKLQPEVDPDTGQRMLTCYLLPQMPNDDRDGLYLYNCTLAYR